MKLVATLLALPLVALALQTVPNITAAPQVRADVTLGDQHCLDDTAFCLSNAKRSDNTSPVAHNSVKPRIASPAPAGVAPLVTERDQVKPGDKCKYNPLSFSMYACSPDKKTIYECHFRTNTWAIFSTCPSTTHCEESNGFCAADPPAARSLRPEALERRPVKLGDKCKYDHLSFDMYSCSPDKKTIYECSPQTNQWQVSQTCPTAMHCIPQSGFCVSDGPAKIRRSPEIVTAIGVPVHDSNGVVRKLDSDSEGKPSPEKTYTLPLPQPTMKVRDLSLYVKEGDACSYNPLNSASFSSCGENRRDVFHCNPDTSKWELFWTCKGKSHCEDGGDFCILGAPDTV